MSISPEAVRGEGLLTTGKPVVVLFSGGRDSTCLLDLTPVGASGWRSRFRWSGSW